MATAAAADMAGNRTPKQQTGDAGEARAASFLAGLGYVVVGRNVQVGRDELDVICEDGDIVVFVEVRTRVRTVDALESVTPAKQRRVARAAARWLGPLLNRRFVRFDVVAVDDDGGVTHIKDAFRVA
jgi:putative endonuclease